jgi:hypothetical protein
MRRQARRAEQGEPGGHVQHPVAEGGNLTAGRRWHVAEADLAGRASVWPAVLQCQDAHRGDLHQVDCRRGVADLGVPAGRMR